MLDYRALSPSLVSSLVVGLRADSRIRMHYGRARATVDQLYTAMVIDCLNILIWHNTKNGHKGRGKPKSLYKMLTEEEKKEELETFEEPDDYLKWRKCKGM